MGAGGAGDGGARPCHGGTAAGQAARRRRRRSLPAARTTLLRGRCPGARRRSMATGGGRMARAARGGGGPAGGGGGGGGRVDHPPTARGIATHRTRLARGGYATTVRWIPQRSFPLRAAVADLRLARLIVRPRGAAARRAPSATSCSRLPPTAPPNKSPRQSAARRSARFRGGGGGDDAESGSGRPSKRRRPTLPPTSPTPPPTFTAASRSVRCSCVRAPTPPERAPRDAGSSCRPREMPLPGRAAVGARRAALRAVARRAARERGGGGSGTAELEGWLEKLPSWAAALRGWQMEGAS